MQIDKSPGNNWLTTEIYETLWNKIKEIFVDYVSETKEKGHLKVHLKDRLSLSQHEKNKDKRFILNWRLICLLNVDLRIISKAFSEKLKKVLPD